MTIANRQGRDAGGDGRERGKAVGASRRPEGDLRKKKTRSRPLGEGAGGRKGGAKGEADVADLLAVSALESGIFPAINPDAGADALLDVMVQADLQRAERGAPAVEKRSERGAAVEAAGDAGDGAVVAERDVIDEPARSGEDGSVFH